MSNGYWSHENFFKRKLAELGRVETIRDLECIIGVISHARCCAKGIEMTLGPLQKGFKTFKSG